MIGAALAILAVSSIAAYAGMIEEIERAEIVMHSWGTLTPADREVERPPGAVSFLQHGKASWYGRTGRPTANGEKYPTAEMTCAHRDAPFGTIFRVTRLDSGRSIRCRVNDRGPFVSGRIIDLNPKAAAGLGMVGAGVVKVRVEIVARN